MLVVGAHAREDEEGVLPHPLPLLERGGNIADLRHPPRPRLATRVHPHHRKSLRIHEDNEDSPDETH